MKKIICIITVSLLVHTMFAQSLYICSDNGKSIIIRGFDVDAIYPDTSDNRQLYVQMLSGEKRSISDTVDSVIIAKYGLEPFNITATNIQRNSVTLSATIGLNLQARVLFRIYQETYGGNAITIWGQQIDGTSTFTAEVTGLSAGTLYIVDAVAYNVGNAVQSFYSIPPHSSFTTPGYSIGDLYPSDESPQGVVFYVYNNGLHGKIVSLIHSYAKWDVNGLFSDDTGGYDYMDGSQNYINPNRSPMQKWINDNLGSPWYCPATNELTTLCNNINTVNAKLTVLGHAAHEGFFWSSTQHNSNQANVVTLTNYLGYANGYSFYADKDNSYDVLGIMKF